MIVVNGIDFGTLEDPIYVNGERVLEVWANGVKVYPEEKKVNRYAMFFKFSSDVISKYSPEPVNEYGCYAKFTNLDNIYKVAFGVYLGGSYPQRQLFYSYKNFAAGGTATYVPYVGKDGYIVVDALSGSGMNTFQATQKSSGGKTYYSTISIGANLEDKDGHYLADYSVATSSENVQIFSSESAAISWILS